MATYTDDILYIGQPGTSNTDLYTVPADTITRISNIHICNTSGTDDTITLYVVQSGDSAGNDVAIVPNSTIPANGFLSVDLPIPLRTAGDKIVGIQNTATACTVLLIGLTESTA